MTQQVRSGTGDGIAASSSGVASVRASANSVAGSGTSAARR
jgi:hypothetical protein